MKVLILIVATVLAVALWSLADTAEAKQKKLIKEPVKIQTYRQCRAKSYHVQNCAKPVSLP